MKVWITEHAFTQGIIEKEAETTIKKGIIKIIDPSGNGYGEYYNSHFKQWFPDKESAIKWANERRLAKIKDLKCEMSKLESIKFD